MHFSYLNMSNDSILYNILFMQEFIDFLVKFAIAGVREKNRINGMKRDAHARAQKNYTTVFINLEVNTIVHYLLHGRAKLRSIARGKYTTVYCAVSTTLMYTPTLHDRALVVSPFSYK